VQRDHGLRHRFRAGGVAAEVMPAHDRAPPLLHRNLPHRLPESARYRVLPEIEAATTIRSGPAASIFPVVYHDLVRWIDERGYRSVEGPGREVWVNMVDDIADVAQQVFEIQLPFTRTGGPQ
jgi:hypothetical protein